MDTGEGKMEYFKSEKELNRLKEYYPNHGKVFKEGQTVGVFEHVGEDEFADDSNKGHESLFKIEKITPDGLILKLLPKEVEKT